jgi:Tol biopolymer transport system component
MHTSSRFTAVSEARLISAARWLGAAFLVCACEKPEPVAPTSAAEAAPQGTEPAASGDAHRHPEEIHLSQIQQLTTGGENAEAYWSFDGTKLIYQAHEGEGCDQIYVRDARDPASQAQRVSTGEGATTCAYFLPSDQEIIYASTHLAGAACPPKADQSQGYVWAIYDSYDIFRANADGTNLRQLTSTPGYDAEGTVCGKDGSIIFTSVRDQDLELYRMDADGKNVKRLTNTPGYDGGAFFSADCTKIVWRASRPTGESLSDYQKLLAQGLVRPTKLELFVANADGSNARQVTELNAAAFGPFFYPSGERIVFSSNYGDPKGREFDLWAINVDGSGLERITHAPGFDGFPMFSPDGKSFVFASNRASRPGTWDTNLFVANWLDTPPSGPAQATK